HDQAGDARRQMCDIVDWIDLEQSKGQAVGIVEGGRVRDDEDRKKTGSVKPGEFSQHERFYRTLLPGGGGSSNDRSTGLPPSGLAASTMPFDSTPISVAGCRLNTITIVRPTRASGSYASAIPATIVHCPV